MEQEPVAELPRFAPQQQHHGNHAEQCPGRNPSERRHPLAATGFHEPTAEVLHDGLERRRDAGGLTNGGEDQGCAADDRRVVEDTLVEVVADDGHHPVGEQQTADDRPSDRSDAAEVAEREHGQAEPVHPVRRAHRDLLEGGHDAGHAGDGSRDGEREQFGPHHVDPGRGCGALVRPDGEEPAASATSAQVGDGNAEKAQHDDAEDREVRVVVQPGLAHGTGICSEHVGRIEHGVRSRSEVGELLVLEVEGLQGHCGSKRHDGELHATDAQRREPQYYAHDDGNDDAEDRRNRPWEVGPMYGER